MGEKTTQLSIVIRTIDRATAGIKAINERLDEVTKPVRDFKKQLGELAEKSGLNTVAEGFKGVGEAVTETLFKFLEVGVVVGEAVHLVLELVEGYEELGKKAERLGVGVDFLAQTRAAAERTGASVEQLDTGMEAFSQSLGQARAGTGRMLAFLNKVSPALARQLVAAKSNEEAFALLSDAMAKIEDPAKRAALAQKTVGDAALAPLLHRGAKGIEALREEYSKSAGSQAEAAKAAGETHEAMLDLKDATDGVKAALVEGLAPALKIIIKQIAEWLGGHREDIKEWAAALGKKLPGAFNAVVGALGQVIDAIKPFVDSGTKLKVLLVALAAIMVGPLLSAIVTLGIALLTTPIGWILAGVAALSIAWYEVITNWDGVKKWLGEFWDYLDEKTHGAIQVLKLIALPFIAFPAAVYAAWGPLKSFFGTLWDGITWAFRKAWDVIGPIVDKVIAGVHAIQDFLSTDGTEVDEALSKSSSFGYLAKGHYAGGYTTGDALNSLMQPGGASSSSAKITVDFANAPRGTRVSTAPQSTADVDLSVGYQMGLTP